MNSYLSIFICLFVVLQIFVLVDEQRVTLKAEVDPSLIEKNKEEFIRLQFTPFFLLLQRRLFKPKFLLEPFFLIYLIAGVTTVI